MVPVHLLIYSVQTAMTTLTCIVDFLSWSVETKVKMDLGGLYGPYLALGKCLSALMSLFGSLETQKVLLTNPSCGNGTGHVREAAFKDLKQCESVKVCQVSVIIDLLL